MNGNHFRDPVLILTLLPLLLLAACEDDPTGEELPPVPTVTGVSETVLAPGDTLIVTGSNFLEDLELNRVRFNNPAGESVPFDGTTTQLSVVVDQDALTGPISVFVQDQPEPGVGPEVTIARGLGDVWVYGKTGVALELPHSSPATQYLVIPHATDPAAPYTQEHSYTVDSSNPTPPPPASSPASALTVSEAFELRRWERAAELLASAGEIDLPRRNTAAMTAGHAAAQSRQFYVLNTTSGSVNSASSFSRITAVLRYSGTRCLIYSDVDTLAAGENLSDSDFADFGDYFDNQIDPTNVNFFGDYSDVDQDGKVIILVTPVVNRLTPPGSGSFIGGFFLANDLFEPNQGANPGTTNFAEVFYVLASDPKSTWGNPFPVGFTAQENVKTIAHEHEHLISFSHRIFNQERAVQITWLEEGMAHMAEDLNGINTSNINRANLYLDDPGRMSLEHNTSPTTQRGGIYLFLRLLGDRYGDDIYKKIVQSKCTGRNCIQAVTGEGFYRLVADFLAALYLSGKGITTDPRYNYSSIDLTDFNPVTTTIVLVGENGGGTVRRATGDLLLYSGAVGNSCTLTFRTTSATAGLRAVIVRTQ